MLSMSLLVTLTDSRGLTGTLKAGGLPMVASGLLMFGSASALILSIKYTVVANTMALLVYITSTVSIRKFPDKITGR